jgi:nitrogen-specific signal transduction histidine kinase
MEVYNKVIQVGSLKIEISISDRTNTILYQSPSDHQTVATNPYYVNLTARDEDDKRIWQTPVMDDHGEVKFYTSVYEAIEDARRKLGEAGEGLQFDLPGISKELQILLIEDIQEDLELMSMTLRKAGMRFKIKQVDTREEFVQALADYNADIILSDHAIPQFNSLEALAMARKVKTDIPFIIVSGGVSQHMAKTCIQQGANDYVLKSDIYRLPLAIQKALRTSNTSYATREDLIHRVEELTKTNHEIEHMIYGVAHNLRSPLNSVLGLLDLAKQESEAASKNLKHYFQMMEESIRKLDSSVNDLLKYARNSKREITIEKIDFRTIIEDGIQQMKFMKGFDRIRATVDVNQSSLFYSDAYRIRAIINNLISNSVKYMDYSKSSPSIEVNVEVKKHQATLAFKDNGIGINSSYLSKIFSMFYRATSQNEGSGLGLYLVKETVQRLGGTIHVESEEGDGTAFYITLPNHYATSMS